VEERRASHRSRTFRGGKILFNDRRSVLDCTIRNLSPEGACLQVESLVGVPAAFELLIDGEEAPRPCRLAWQSHDRAGVEFALRQAEALPSDPPHARVATPRASSDLRWPSRNGAGAPTGRSRSS
jgi:hypothetical protein